jgi:hypothetical protein
MGNDSFSNDPRTIWQNQPTEPSIMTLEKIRQKTQELRAKTRRDLLGGMALPLFVASISGWGIAWASGTVVRAVCALAVAWSLAGQYFLNRGMWSATLPEDAALSTGIESYRREVERRRYLSARFLLWSFGPMALAIAILPVTLLSLGIRRGILPKETLLNMIPFLTVVVIWIVSVFVIRMRDQRKLQREIDELNDIERASL